MCIGGNYIWILESYHIAYKILGNLTWFNSVLSSIFLKKVLLGWNEFNKMDELLVPPHCFQISLCT